MMDEIAKSSATRQARQLYMNMKSGSISRTLEVNLVVKAATKPNRMPKPIPPRPTTKNLAIPRNTSTGSTTGMFATKLNMLYNTWKHAHIHADTYSYMHSFECMQLHQQSKHPSQRSWVVSGAVASNDTVPDKTDLLKYLLCTVCNLIISFHQAQ